MSHNRWHACLTHRFIAPPWWRNAINHLQKDWKVTSLALSLEAKHFSLHNLTYLNEYSNRGQRLPFFSSILEDQTQVNSEPAGQPEQASLNQCQLIAANRPKLVLCASPADGGDKVSLYCNRYESPDWSLPTSDLTLIPYLVLLAWVQLFTIGQIVIGLSLHIHSFLHPRFYTVLPL